MITKIYFYMFLSFTNHFQGNLMSKTFDINTEFSIIITIEDINTGYKLQRRLTMLSMFVLCNT